MLKEYCKKIATTLNSGEIILIGGLSRSGKTTFSSQLSESLNGLEKSNRLISMDCWLRDKDDRADGVMGRFDLTAIQGLIRDLKRTQQNFLLEIPEYNKFLQKKIYNGNVLDISPNDILIIEGVLALEFSNIVPGAKKYYVQIDEALRKTRVVDEYLMRGYNKVEAEAIYLRRQLDEVPVIQMTSKNAIHINIQHLNS